jgi:hypothetical protein
MKKLIVFIAAIVAVLIIAGRTADATVTAGTINGLTITGGTITGTAINNGSGTFTVDSSGNVTSTNLLSHHGLRVDGGTSYTTTLDTLVRIQGQVDPANPSVKGSGSAYLCVDSANFVFACQ